MISCISAAASAYMSLIIYCRSEKCCINVEHYNNTCLWSETNANNFQICASAFSSIPLASCWQAETFELNFDFMQKADQHIQNANPWELKRISTALVVNLCESILLLAENLSSGVCKGSIQVLGNTLAAHERAAHHPTETHNVKCLFQNQNRRLFNRRAIMAGSLLFNLHIRNETLHFCGCWYCKPYGSGSTYRCTLFTKWN